MGLFDFFRGRLNKGNKPGGPLEVSFSSSYDTLRIWSIDFYGQYSKSPNGEYIIACQDSEYRGKSGGGFRESGYGRTILLRNKQLVYQIGMQRPFKGAVSNNGIGAIYDIGFGESPKGTFCVLSPDGEPIITYQKGASYPTPGISDRGEISWLSTGNELFFFSLPKRCLLFQLIEHQPPERVEIAENQLHVTLRSITRKYDSSGALLNSDEVEKAELKWLVDKGDSFSLEAKAAELLDNLKSGHRQPQSAMAEIDMLLETALERENDDTGKARIHRRLGEGAEAIGDKVGAKHQYIQALRYDPKVGVKRALASIEKELARKKHQ